MGCRVVRCQGNVCGGGLGGGQAGVVLKGVRQGRGWMAVGHFWELYVFYASL